MSYSTPDDEISGVVYIDEAAPYAAEDEGFEQRYSTHLPVFAVDGEPFLQDAIEKAEILASGYPVQAYLEFSVEPGLPFVLVLERATPALAVRSMVEYVEFLASIATPPRGRIVMRSIAHLDRSFHRNVLAALEPYFGDGVDVEQRSDVVEIVFAESDPNWNRFPEIPTA